MSSLDDDVHLTLEEMNPKQRQKEFKTTQKDIKSKDFQVSKLAFTKLENHLYLSEGGCFPVLLQTLHPKPVR
jgi:hypothetical protein